MLNLTVERCFKRQLEHLFNRLHRDLSVTVPTFRIETDILDASYLEDRLQFQMTLDRIGRSSLSFKILSKCGEEERLRAIIKLVCIDYHKKKAAPWSDVLRDWIVEIIANDKPDKALPRPDASILKDY